MVFSTIDIGTNTILMVTLAVQPGGEIQVLGDEHGIARLGKGVDATRRILPEAFDRLAGHLIRYREIARELGSEWIVAFGTSALRDARNRDEFIAAMEERTSIHIETLSGQEEAELTYRGALFGFRPGAHCQGVIDIGGGSTEIAFGSNQNLERGISLDIGAVRVTERFFPQLPPTPEQIEEARAFIRGQLSLGFDLPSDVEMVGVAGTVTTLGAIAARMTEFDADELNGTRLTDEEIAEITRDLSRMPVEDIVQMRGVHPERADILLGGALVLDEFMRSQDLPALTVSIRGVRYGVAMREIERMGYRG